MKLYIVVYLAAEIAMTIGPVPYDETECRRRVEEKMVEVRQSEGYRKDPDAVWIKCEWHHTRPIRAEKYR